MKKAILICAAVFCMFMLGSMYVTAKAEAKAAKAPLILMDFESPADFKEKMETDSDDEYDPNINPADQSADNATHGKFSAHVTDKPKAGGIHYIKGPADWSEYGVIKFDVFVPGKNPLGGRIMVADNQSELPKDRPKALGNYDTRFDAECMARPGKSTVEFEITGLATNSGSRPIDLKHITKYAISFKGEYYIDNIRLEQSEE